MYYWMFSSSIDYLLFLVRCVRGEALFRRKGKRRFAQATAMRVQAVVAFDRCSILLFERTSLFLGGVRRQGGGNFRGVRARSFMVGKAHVTRSKFLPVFYSRLLFAANARTVA